jgi:hypothetical protein
MHEGVEARIGLCMPFVGEVSVEHGGFEVGMAQVALDEPGGHAGFEQRGSVRMSKGMDGDAHFGDPGALFGFAEGALDPGATHGGGRRGTLGVIPPSGRNQPGGVPMGFPVGAEQSQRLDGQGDIAVFGALPPVAMDLEALTIEVGDLQKEGFVKPESQAIERGEVDLVMQGGSRLEDTSDFFKTEDSGEVVRGLRAHERQRSPVAFEDVLIEEANPAVAATHGRGGEAINIVAVQEGVLQLLFGDTVGGFAVELSQQTDFTDIGCLSPFALAADVESRDHLLTQRGHEISPCVRRVVYLRRKTS